MVYFWLGTHHVNWLWDLEGIPLFVSRRRLIRYKSFKRARCPWVLDSGAFTELNMYGKWLLTAEEYAAEAVLWSSAIGKMKWASIQDWMCEPSVLDKTGLDIVTHQHLTIQSLVDLRRLEPSIHWIPVLQGWDLNDYLRHVGLYHKAGINLSEEPIVGLGSICRRQGTKEVALIVEYLSHSGVNNIHGFGVKKTGLIKAARYFKPADSMAWSYCARRAPPLPNCTHKNCANCKIYALQWRQEILDQLEGNIVTTCNPNRRRLISIKGKNE